MVELDSSGNTIGMDSSYIESEFYKSTMKLFRYNEWFSDSLSSFLSVCYIYSNGNDISYIYDTTNVANLIKIAQHTFKNGDNWFVDDPMFNCSFWVEYYGNVQVPAGIFDSCFFVHYDSTSGWIFAPDVGFVKIIKNNKDVYLLKDYKINNSNNVVAFNNEKNQNIFQINTSLYSHIAININSPSKTCQIMIFSIDGKKILSCQSNSLTWETSQFSKGTYIISVEIEKIFYYKKVFLIN